MGMEELQIQQRQIADLKTNLSYYLNNRILDLRGFNSMVLARNNIFVDGILAMMELKNGEWLLSGHCEGVMHFGEFADARIHIADTSDIKIMADAPSMLHIDVYNNSRVEVVTNGKPKVVISIHSDLAEVIAPKNAVIEHY